MNLENLFEDLEVRYEALRANRAEGLQQVGTITLLLRNRTLKLNQLHFAKDFVLGRCGTALIAIPHRSLRVLLVQPGEATTSRTVFRRWLEALPEATWLRVEVGAEQSAGSLRYCQNGLLGISDKLIATTAIECIEIRAVENSTGVSPSDATL